MKRILRWLVGPRTPAAAPFFADETQRRLADGEAGAASLHAAELVALAGPAEDLSYRARYNLACYHSIAGALDPKEARRLFALALEDLRVVAEAGDRELLASAADDDALDAVRAYDEGAFWKVIPRPAAKDAADEKTKKKKKTKKKTAANPQPKRAATTERPPAAT